MGRNKHNALASSAEGRSVKERHQRSARDNIAIPRNLAVLPEKNIKSKHQSYFQFFENKDRKDKKLEFEVTTDPNPPPGFEFVPSGNPELTQACKELSRESDALVFIVSGAKDAKNDGDNVKELALHVHRMGHHIRQTIVEQAKALVGKEIARAASDNWQLPETQEEINNQAEAALRDLFPRIPNFDKQMIIEHSFRKGEGYGKPKVGTSDLPLYRRVQLAVLAHIRHTHTRYDKLLKEIDWHVARKMVEETCLDILVKWRGDEETGRDQLDDILREVVVISDDSDDSDDSNDVDDEEDGDLSEDDAPRTDAALPAAAVDAAPGLADVSTHTTQPQTKKRKRKARAKTNRIAKHPLPGSASEPRLAGVKNDKRGFKRYEAVQKRWEEAVNRNRHAQSTEKNLPVSAETVLGRSMSQRLPSVEFISSIPRTESKRLNRPQSLSQPSYAGGQEYGQLARTHDATAINLYREEHTVSDVRHPDPTFGRMPGTVVGRRVGPPLPNPRNVFGTDRTYHHGELQDMLVPSVEPTSPNSWSDPPQFVRRVAREEPIRFGQVPTGHHGAPDRQFIPMGSHFVVAESRNPPLDHDFTSALLPPAGERSISRYNMSRPQDIYKRESRLHSAVVPPQSDDGIYRIRETVEDPCHQPGMSGNDTTTRIVRVHREARPSEIWDPEPLRPRTLSPRRVEPYARPPPSAGHGPSEYRRVVYRDVGNSRPEQYTQVTSSVSSRPLFYEVAPAQSGSWQGSTFVRPGPPGQYTSENFAGSGDDIVRHSTQGPILDQRGQSMYHHRGHSYHERTHSGPAARADAFAEPGNMRYSYEERASPRDVIIIR